MSKLSHALTWSAQSDTKATVRERLSSSALSLIRLTRLSFPIRSRSNLAAARTPQSAYIAKIFAGNFGLGKAGEQTGWMDLPMQLRTFLMRYSSSRMAAKCSMSAMKRNRFILNLTLIDRG